MILLNFSPRFRLISVSFIIENVIYFLKTSLGDIEVRSSRRDEDGYKTCSWASWISKSLFFNN